MTNPVSRSSSPASIKEPEQGTTNNEQGTSSLTQTSPWQTLPRPETSQSPLQYFTCDFPPTGKPQQSEKKSSVNADPATDWSKKNTELISAVSNLTEQRKLLSLEKSPLTTSGEGYFYSTDQLQSLLSQEKPAHECLLKATNVNGTEINGVIDFEKSKDGKITLINKEGSMVVDMGDLSFEKSNPVTIKRVNFVANPIPLSDIPDAFAQFESLRAKKREIDKAIYTLIESLSPSALQELAKAVPDAAQDAERAADIKLRRPGS